jgi:hypothetical protein
MSDEPQSPTQESPTPSTPPSNSKRLVYCAICGERRWLWPERATDPFVCLRCMALSQRAEHEVQL